MRKALLTFAPAIVLLALLLNFLEVRSQKSEARSLTVTESSVSHVKVSFTLPSWTMEDVAVGREDLVKVSMEGSFLPNEEGAPDLPSVARYIALPKGAEPRLNVTYSSVETLQGQELAPAPRIPKTTENGPLHYEKDMAIWSKDAFYPARPVLLSEVTQIRGVDVVLLGISPFQYNPVTKELRVYQDLEVEVTFEGDGLTVGEERLRSRFWDPIIMDAVLNGDIIPQIDHQAALGRAIQSRQSLVPKSEASSGSVISRQSLNGRDLGCEYLIIVPDQPDFLAWADTLRRFRNEQGIMTDVMTTTEIGGNSVAAIENFVNDAYNTWDIVPAAILLLGDYAADNTGIIAPIWDNYCASDNIFADVTNNDMPDIVFSRMTAQTATHLEYMINKIIDYETDPPVDPDYYDRPITALGWQTERWFQICIEVVGGFFRNELDKNPVRVNALYQGNPAVDPWSTAPNTTTIMNYFGPNGLGYIPSSPTELGNWSGGNATMINNAINNGSFLLLHRDHGYEQGWGEPAYSNSNLSGLNNEEPTFVYSVNCLTGKYNWGSTCFTEAFHRHPKRAVGLIAASEVSYSFVNDVYVWGAFDNMWTEFMPDYGSTPEPRGLYPSFSNAAGKYFLQQSGWPYNTGNKEVTYNLFHHHGDAFNEMYSEVPQDLLVLHNSVVMAGNSSFTVQADELSWIALSLDGEILGIGQGTGQPVEITIPTLSPGDEVKVVVTKTNHFRYETFIPVIAPNAPYVVYQEHQVGDSDGNGNGLMDYGESIDLGMTIQNIGLVDAQDINVTLSSADPNVTLTDFTENYGLIGGNSAVTIAGAFAFNVADTIEDGHNVLFSVECSDGDTAWTSQFIITAHAPRLEFFGFEVDDSDGDGNGRIDPGETVEMTVTIINNGSSGAFDVMNELVSNDTYIEILTAAQSVGDLGTGMTGQATFTVHADEATPGGFPATFMIAMSGSLNIAGSGEFSTLIGQYPALIIDMDPNQYSGPVILETFGNMDLYANYSVLIPDDIANYNSVFVSLGIHNSNHILTNAEAQVLADYLEQGGNLFMEGRTTWYEDPQTDLHSMFSVNSLYSGWFALDTLAGEDGTFTEGMKFGFEGVNSYNNYTLEASSPAYEVFTNQEDGGGIWIAHNAGSYKTIAANMEFGSLVDTEFPSTKENLMQQVLNFFGDIYTGSGEDLFKSAEYVHAYPNPYTERVTFLVRSEKTSQVTLEIFDLTGQKVATVFDGALPAGASQVSWNGTGTVPAMCFYRLKTEQGVYSGKLIRK